MDSRMSNAVDDFVFKRTDSINAGGGDPAMPLLLLFPPGLLVDLFLPRCPPRPPACGGGGGADMFLFCFVCLLRCCVRFRFDAFDVNQLSSIHFFGEGVHPSRGNQIMFSCNHAYETDQEF
jgi:hypothetical protein